MINAVVKGSYIRSGAPKAKSRAIAHGNYILYRTHGEQEERRQFFDDKRDTIDSNEFRNAIREYDGNGPLVHKMILSPGIQGVDLKTFTREAMEELGKQKGLDLRWQAVEHHNTEHSHVHVIVFGEDRHGQPVRFRAYDFGKMRQSMNRYLDREHRLERYLDREIPDLIRYGERDTLNALLFGDAEKSARDKRRLDEDRRRFDDELGKNKPFERDEIGRRPTKGEYIRRMQGKLLDEHGQYGRSMAMKRLGELAETNPELAVEIASEMQYVRSIGEEERRDKGLTDLDRLLGARTDNVEKQRTPANEFGRGEVLNRSAEQSDEDRGAAAERQARNIDVSGQGKPRRSREDDEQPGGSR